MDPLIAAGIGLITGAGSGIGKATAIHFARRGCKKLFLVDISEKGLQETKSVIKSSNKNVEIAIRVTDISDEDAVKDMVDECVKNFGRIDFACNIAGIAMGNTMTHEIDTKTFEKVHNVNTRGAFLCQKYEVTAMLQQEPLFFPGSKYVTRGSIVNMASMAGLAVMPTFSAYSASKHAIVSMTRVDARQYAAKGIRVNCVCPGFVDTPLMRGPGLTDEWMRAVESQAPMNRTIDPSEVAEAVVFLSGSGASAVTGISMPVDGGALLFHIV